MVRVAPFFLTHGVVTVQHKTGLTFTADNETKCFEEKGRMLTWLKMILIATVSTDTQTFNLE